MTATPTPALNLTVLGGSPTLDVASLARSNTLTTGLTWVHTGVSVSAFAGSCRCASQNGNPPATCFAKAAEVRGRLRAMAGWGAQVVGYLSCSIDSSVQCLQGFVDVLLSATPTSNVPQVATGSSDGEHGRKPAVRGVVAVLNVYWCV